MSKYEAEVYYHVKEDLKQQIIVDADNIKGNILFPRLEKRTLPIQDVRSLKIQPTFKRDSIEFFNSPTEITSFSDTSFKAAHDRELTSLIKNKLQAKEATVFDHTIREDQSSLRPPARHAHVDYSSKSAEEQIHKHIPEIQKKTWLNGNYSIVNAWRPIENPVSSAPLGFIDLNSVNDQDLITIDLIYPNRVGEVLGALYSAQHSWLYLSDMSPNEIVLFNMYNNKDHKPVVHSAFDIENSGAKTIRKSIESRTLVRF